MADAIEQIAGHLRAQRDMNDPVSEARKESMPDPRRIVETLNEIRALVLDETPTPQLDATIQVIHGMVSGLVGSDKATRFLDELPDIRHCIAMDVEAAFNGDPASKTYSEIIASYPSINAVSTYRIAHAFYQLREPVVARIMAEEAHGKTGIDIHPGAAIGCHFFIDHGTGVVIGETTVIGNRVKLYHGVTLGAFSNRQGREDMGRKRHPTIEDDVTIYPNATILGGGTVVGANSVIGGNAWLTKSVPADSRVVTEPPHLHIQQAGQDPDPDYEI